MNTKKCPYVILGVEKNATRQTIRKAYHRLALRYHPDKVRSHTKTDSRTYFEIKRAYESLCDPIKKEIIDHISTTRDDDLDLVYMTFIRFIILVIQLVKNKAKPHPLFITLEVPLKDVYENHIKKLVIYTKRIDHSNRTETFYIRLIDHKNSYVFLARGDEYLEGNRIKRSDVHIHLKILDEENIHRDTLMSSYDLCYDLNISLYEYLFGFTKQLRIFNDWVQCTYQGGEPMICTLLDCGLPYIQDNQEKRGLLYIILHLSLPRNVHWIQKNANGLFREACAHLLA